MFKKFYFLLFLVPFCFISLNIHSKEKLTVVLCATGEIGQEVTNLLSHENKKVLVLGRNQKKLQELSQKYHFPTLSIDFSKRQEIFKLQNYLEQENPLIEGFVLITPRPSFATNSLPDEDSWIEMVTTCFTRPLELLKMSLPYMEAKSNVVILSGVTSVQALPEYASYGVLRVMWLSEAKSLAWKLSPQGVYVNTVSPGHVRTQKREDTWKKEAIEKGVSFEKIIEEKTKLVPTRNIPSAQNVGRAILFFLNERENITGQNLVIDGGSIQTY